MDGDRIIPIETRYIELMFDELLMYETFSLWVKIDSTEICVCSSYIAADATPCILTFCGLMCGMGVFHMYNSVILVSKPCKEKSRK